MIPSPSVSIPSDAPDVPEEVDEPEVEEVGIPADSELVFGSLSLLSSLAQDIKVSKLTIKNEL